MPLHIVLLYGPVGGQTLMSEAPLSCKTMPASIYLYEGIKPGLGYCPPRVYRPTVATPAANGVPNRG